MAWLVRGPASVVYYTGSSAYEYHRLVPVSLASDVSRVLIASTLKKFRAGVPMHVPKLYQLINETIVPLALHDHVPSPTFSSDRLRRFSVAPASTASASSNAVSRSSLASTTPVEMYVIPYLRTTTGPGDALRTRAALL